MMRVGMLTSGGDCQGLNPALRGVAKSLYETVPGVEILGILNGYKGLIENEVRPMTEGDFSNILTLGGTILGTSRRPFKMMRVIEDDGIDKVAAMKENYRKLGLDCLVILGGNGTQKTAHLLHEEGLHVVSLPKTIDNDVFNTDMTFGFNSAVGIATHVIDCIHTTATSHGRIFVVELMGHKVGWLALYAGIAGGADVILLPEIPYHLEAVLAALEKRRAAGKKFSIVAMAEGAMSQELMDMDKKERKRAIAQLRAHNPSVAYDLADRIKENGFPEIRVAVPGHFQRGGEPSAADRVLTTRLGAHAAKLIRDGKFGYMAAVKGDTITEVPLDTVAGRLKYVPADCQEIQAARSIGISFGNEI